MHHRWLRGSQVSLYPPPALDYQPGEKVWFDPTGSDVKQVGEGMLRHGDQGEVMGPSPGDTSCLLVRFSGLRDFVPIEVREVRTAARTALYIFIVSLHLTHAVPIRPLQPYCSPRPCRPPLTVHGAQTGSEGSS